MYVSCSTTSAEIDISKFQGVDGEAEYNVKVWCKQCHPFQAYVIIDTSLGELGNSADRPFINN